MNLPITTRNRNWTHEAACHGQAHIFFGADDDFEWEYRTEEAAKQVCRSCPVRDECLIDDLPHLSHGVRGATNRWERAHIASADEEKLRTLHSLHDELGDDGCQELRSWWESTHIPDSHEIQFSDESQTAAKWGVSPKVALDWRTKLNLQRFQGAEWRGVATKAVLEQLSDRKPRERREVQNIIVGCIPNWIVEDRLRKTLDKAGPTTRLGKKTIRSLRREQTKLANELLWFLSHRKGLLVTWEQEEKDNERGKRQYVQIA